MKKFLFLYFLIVFIFIPQNVFAGGAAARQQQMQIMRQQQMMQQQMLMEQAKKQAMEEAMRAEMMRYLAAKKQAEQKRAMEEALYKKMIEQRRAQQIAQQMAYQKLVNETMKKKAVQAAAQKRRMEQQMHQQRVQAEANKSYQMAMHQKKVQRDASIAYQLAIKQKKAQRDATIAYQMALRKQKGQQEAKMAYQLALQRERNQVQTVAAKLAFDKRKKAEYLKVLKQKERNIQREKEIKEDIVDISDVWERLEHSSEVWALILDEEVREALIDREIGRFKQKGIIIEKEASYYVKRMVVFLRANIEILDYPFKDILRIIAMMDYDFYRQGDHLQEEDSSGPPSSPRGEDEDVVDISAIWKNFETSSELWPRMLDQASREVTIEREVNRFKKDNVFIKKEPLYYVKRIDVLAEADPEILQKPFSEILRIVSMVDYDFQDEENKYLNLSENFNPEESIVDISQVWSKLDHSSEVWSLMIDAEAKEVTVDREIKKYKDKGIIISKKPSYYAQRIDSMASKNPAMLENPFKNILRILAVMDYDFDNGTNKDLMAREVLGVKLYLENKRRTDIF